MPAATVSSTQAGYGSDYIKSQILRVQRGFEAKPLAAGREYLLISPAITIPATSLDTADDRVLLFKLPGDIGPLYLINLTATVTDMDSHATPTLVFDILTHTGSADGDVLISGSTKGQAGGTDELDADTGFRFKDISNKYLCFKVTTGAATVAAGTCTLKFTLYAGSAVSF